MDPVPLVQRFFSECAPTGIVAVYVFGSIARGEDRPGSDVDVAVLLDAPAPKTLDGQPYALQSDLSRMLERNADVVFLNDAPRDLVHRVLRDGRLVFETDRSARIRFEVTARNEYFDMLPIWREYRRARAS